MHYTTQSKIGLHIFGEHSTTKTSQHLQFNTAYIPFTIDNLKKVVLDIVSPKNWRAFIK